MTPETKMRVTLIGCKIPAILFSGLVLLVIGLVIFEMIAGEKEKQEIKPWVTFGRLMFVASGCDEYEKHNGVWPYSLAELHTFRIDLNDPWTKDAWGRDVVLVPYNKSIGYGEIISYGRDGKPGGTGLDSDLVVRYPLKANVTWNKQGSVGLKLPRQLQSDTNWFEEDGYQ